MSDVRPVLGILLNRRPLQYVGRISYGVYVYHPFVPTMLAAFSAWLGVPQKWNATSGCIVSTALALAIAATSWHFFEKPINNLKGHFEDPLRQRPIRAAVQT